MYQFVSLGTRPLGPKNRWAVCALYANDRPSDYWLTARWSEPAQPEEKLFKSNHPYV